MIVLLKHLSVQVLAPNQKHVLRFALGTDVVENTGEGKQAKKVGKHFGPNAQHVGPAVGREAGRR